MQNINKTAVERPASDEYSPYYGRYIGLVPEGDLFDLMAAQPATLRTLMGGLSDEQADYRFGAGEWSIKELIGHLVDVEHILGYRAFRFSRADETPLPGFEQDDYVRASNYSQRTISDLLEEFELLRRANILNFGGLASEAFLRRGVASNNPFTVRSLLYAMVGHVIHHINSLHSDYGLAR
jgi:uncharacterized damage-inducible protein DinB